MTLADTLQALARLEPGRFWHNNGIWYGCAYGGRKYDIWSDGADLTLPLLSAALMELLDAKGLEWLKLPEPGTREGYLYVVRPGADRETLGCAPAGGQPFAITLARAVVQALEAER